MAQWKVINIGKSKVCVSQPSIEKEDSLCVMEKNSLDIVRKLFNVKKNIIVTMIFYYCINDFHETSG
jgi:hypothetical protein